MTEERPAWRRHPWRTAGLTLLALVALVAAAGLAWGLTPLGPAEGALGEMHSDVGITVTDTSYGYEFAPTQASGVGVIIYPGGRVDARSYAPLARAVANQGHLTTIVRMPLSLAVLSPNAADPVIEAHPEIERWVIVGHSLGGVMAASYAREHPDTVGGLVLLAAYPLESVDLRDSGLAVADIVGTHDSVVDMAAWEDGVARLPEDAEILRMEGGNHAQFGDYGEQPGDAPAEITHQEQVKWTTGVVLRVIDKANR